MATQLERDKHARYLLHCLREVPQPYAALDTSRLSLAYFCVAGLDVLAHLGKIDAPLRAGIVEWIYSLQVLPPSDGCAGLPADRLGGFRGSGYLGAAHSSGGAPSSSPYDGAHLAMTYTALAVLLTLGDDLSRVDGPRVLAFVSSLQDEAGCFSAYPGGERDMRFLFCAAAVVAMLRGGAVRTESSGCEPFPDPSRTLLGPFLQVPCLRAAASTSSGRRGTSSSRAGSTAASGSDLGRRGREREGGRGRGREREEEGEGALLRRRGRDHASPPPPQESHGGSTFTGLAALALMGTLRRLPPPQRTVRWCVERQARSSRDRAEIGARSGRAAHLSQVGGFQGRPNKDEDTCYSFWIGALAPQFAISARSRPRLLTLATGAAPGGSLALLGAATLLQRAALSAFCLSCQFAHPTFGGIAKHPDTRPDLLHTHYALCGARRAARPALAPHAPHGSRAAPV